VLITGGAGGLGRGLVQRFHDDGAVVLALDKDSDAIEQLQKELPNVTAVTVDVADWNETKKAIEAFGAIDHVVNNAAILIPQYFMEITKEMADLHFNVNALACINVVQTAAKGMMERGSGGSIVNITSIESTGATAGFSMYSSAKIALEMITKSMSVELGRHNIRANCVSPNGIDGDGMVKISDPRITAAVENLFRRNTIKRLIAPNEVADLVMFLLSPLSAMITGETVVIDGELPKVTAAVVDLSEWTRLERSLNRLEQLVNNAGIIIPQPFMGITKETASLHFNVNTMACVNIPQTAAKGMIERGSGGTIINISSLAIKGASPGTAIYSASKIALEMLTKSMSVELGPNNIRANCIVPNAVNTPMVQVDDQWLNQILKSSCKEVLSNE
ncbi:L-xylulose reductase, partial [Orchesella cincta]